MKLRRIMANGLLSLICAFIFMFSAYSMLSDGYSWAKLGLTVLFVNIICMVVINIIFAVTEIMNKKAGRAVRWIILLMIAAISAFYLFVMKNGTQVYEQLILIAGYYMKDWNAYYGSMVSLISEDPEYVAKGLQFIFTVLCLLVFWIVKMTGKNMVFAIIPFAVLVLEHLVGISPENSGVILLFAGMLLSNASTWKHNDFEITGKNRSAVKRSYCWIYTVVFILCLCSGVKVFGNQSAGNMIQHAEAMKEIRNNIFEKILGIDYEKIFFGEGPSEEDGGVLSGKIDNSTPEYEHRNLMEITLNEMPCNNVYLKGFHANTYIEGEWTYSCGKTFTRDIINWGYDVEEIIDSIADIGNETFKARYDYDNPVNYIKPIEGSIKYTKPLTDRIYLPYFVSSYDGPVVREYDTLYKKADEAEAVSDVSFEMWDCDSDVITWRDEIMPCINYEWEEWYRDYQMRSGTAMGDIEAVNNVMHDIIEEIDEETIRSFLKGNFLNANLEFDFSGYTLFLIEKLKAWFRENVTYGTELDEISEGEDAVNYFIAKGKKGYCAHYASAAAIMLKDFGLNVRYVTGYVATIDSFKKSGDVYKATVKDDCAHAWIEVYIEGIGWFPVEVTQGYTQQERLEKLEKEKKTPAPASTSKPDEKDKKKEKKKEKKDNNTGIDNIVVVIFICLGSAGLIIAVFSFIIRNVKSNKRLERAVRRKATLRAVKIINRNMYRKLRSSGKILKSKVSDDVYKEILMKTYGDIPENDWERYMDIVKAAAFSNGHITEEEMELCYEIYKKCR